MKAFSSTPRRRAGLTLIEVLLVLVILVVLASLAVTAYGPIRERALRDATLAKINGMKTVLELYRMHMNDFPADWEDLITQPAAATGTMKWTGPYLDPPMIPQDARWRRLAFRLPEATGFSTAKTMSTTKCSWSNRLP
ncbi:MAG: type II secretion system protein GspG [Planctomycetota bacterium]